jgi:hypothetical protein
MRATIVPHSAAARRYCGRPISSPHAILPGSGSSQDRRQAHRRSNRPKGSLRAARSSRSTHTVGNKPVELIRLSSQTRPMATVYCSCCTHSIQIPTCCWRTSTSAKSPTRLHRYYTAVRLLASPATASPPRLPVAAQLRRSGLGKMRSPRFRRVPFIRNGVSDHGRVVAPRMTVRNMLPSTFSTASASASSNLSRLNIPLHMIAVYASQPSSPAATQHSLEGGSLLPYPRRSLTGWTAPALPGALRRSLR